MLKLEYHKMQMTMLLIIFVPGICIGYLAFADTMTYVLGLPPLIGGRKSGLEWSSQIGIIPLLPYLTRHIYLTIRAFFLEFAMKVEGGEIEITYYKDFKLKADQIMKIVTLPNKYTSKDSSRARVFYKTEDGQEKSKNLEGCLFKDGTVKSLLMIRDALGADFEIDISAVEEKLPLDIVEKIKAGNP